jgi:hypothetical protein
VLHYVAVVGSLSILQRAWEAKSGTFSKPKATAVRNHLEPETRKRNLGFFRRLITRPSRDAQTLLSIEAASSISVRSRS